MCNPGATPTMDLGWVRELLQQPMVMAHASYFPKGEPRTYAKLFYSLMFGLSFPGSPKALVEKDLQIRGYVGLHTTTWWAAYSGALPVVLKHFLPSILDGMGRTKYGNGMDCKGTEAMSYVLATWKSIFHKMSPTANLAD